MESIVTSPARVNAGKPLRCIEVLPATKSSKHNGYTWEPSPSRPGEGVLTLDTTRSRVTYGVIAIATDWDGWGFVLEKLVGGTDPESERYNVFVCRAGIAHECDCK